MAYQLPALPYDHSALEPVIDAETMKLHHGAHHAAYVKNLTAAVEKHAELGKRPVEELLAGIQSVPEEIRTAVRNHGGGHANHSMFWAIMKPGGGGPASGGIAEALNSAFSSFDSFHEKFNEAGGKHFGSGWVWLVADAAGRLQIITTANQDSPLMQGLYPILGNDLWEHAYYLRYQNRRPEYLKAWWNVVNWAEVNRRFEEAKQALARLRAA